MLAGGCANGIVLGNVGCAGGASADALPERVDAANSCGSGCKSGEVRGVAGEGQGGKLVLGAGECVAEVACPGVRD